MSLFDLICLLIGYIIAAVADLPEFKQVVFLIMEGGFHRSSNGRRHCDGGANRSAPERSEKASSMPNIYGERMALVSFFDDLKFEASLFCSGLFCFFLA